MQRCLYSQFHICVYHFTTNLALNLSILPHESSFMVYIHLHLIVFFPLRSLTNSHVWFCCNAFISSFIACFHLSSFTASCTLFCIETVVNVSTSNAWELARRWCDTYLDRRYLHFAFISETYCFFGIPLVLLMGYLGLVSLSKTCTEESDTNSDMLVFTSS